MKWTKPWRRSTSSETHPEDDARRALDDSTQALAQARSRDSEILELSKRLLAIRRRNGLEELIRSAIQGGN